MAGPGRFGLEGQYALVIGGTSGIGGELAKGFLQAGARVIVAGSNQARLDQALADLALHDPAFDTDAAHRQRYDVCESAPGVRRPARGDPGQD